MSELPYFNLPDQPETLSGTNGISRFVDALGFRFRWATEDFTQKEIDFRADPSSMTMMEVITHIHDMMVWVNKSFGGENMEGQKPVGFEDTRTATLLTISKISNLLKAAKDEDFHKLKVSSRIPADPDYWFFLNGPIADALTHVGQITTWRRISGNPQPKGVNLFLGTKT